MRVLALVFALATIVAEMQGQVSKQPFGKTPDGTQVDIYTLKSGKIEARVITYGGILQSLKVPDKGGKSADVVLGFDSIDGYTGGAKPNPAFFGALIGRYANRIANGKFTLDGKTYSTPQNDGTNTLHGGPKGFD
jgi:aldose 1-epimerase